jgi:hypothetical protein
LALGAAGFAGLGPCLRGWPGLLLRLWGRP